MEPEYSDKAIERINYYLNNGCKLRGVNKENKFIHFEIIKGIDFSTDPPVLLVDKEKYTLTTEIDLFVSTLAKHYYYTPCDRGIILIDVVGYSKYDTSGQNAILTTMKRAIKEQLAPLFMGIPFDPILQIIPTGDGCYLVCDERVNDRFHHISFAIFSAMHVMQNRIIKESGRNHKEGTRIELRVGCHVGECDLFVDLAGNTNCYGIAMNETARILAYGQKQAENNFAGTDTSGSLFLSEIAHQQSVTLINYMKNDLKLGILVEDLGLVPDKHGMERRIWWARNLNKYSMFRLYSIEECIQRGW